MTQLTVTLEKGADSSLLRTLIENLRGVAKVTFTHTEHKVRNLNTKGGANDKIHDFSKQTKLSPETKKWLDEMNSLSASIDPDVIDMDDERTRYILRR